jgi:hypothetical protein
MRDIPSIYPSDSAGYKNYGTPSNIALSGATVAAAAAANAVVGNLTTTDANDTADFTYTLVTQSAAGKFKVVAAQLQVATTGGTTGAKTVTIRSTDTRGLKVEKTFTITVT